MSSSTRVNVLQNLLKGHQAVLGAQLNLARAGIPHSGTKGEVSEDQWRGILAGYLPSRYRVAKGQVVDSCGNYSEQIDVIVHDAHYCPRFLESETTVFVPAESVYGVFEVKQEITVEYLRQAAGKAASVRRLHRTSSGIIDCGVEKPARELFPILGGILATASSWQDGLDGVKDRLIDLPADGYLDLGCAVYGGTFDRAANGQVECFPADVALATFLLRLVHRLQALGTVPAINWPAYFTAAFPELVEAPAR